MPHELLDSQVIGQTRVVDGKIYRAVANISSDLEIVIAEGFSDEDDGQFDPGSSQMRELEISQSGEIVAG